MFAHSVVPHHHHQAHISTHNSNLHIDADDHDDLDNNFLEKAFSHIQHVSNSSINCQITTATSSQHLKFVLDDNAILVAQYVLKQFFKPPIIHQAHNSFAFTSIQFSASNLFRGPPSA